jgi:hypothetical protein
MAAANPGDGSRTHRPYLESRRTTFVSRPSSQGLEPVSRLRGTAPRYRTVPKLTLCATDRCVPALQLRWLPVPSPQPITQPPAGPGCRHALLRGLPERAAGVVRCATGGRPARRPHEPPRTGMRGWLEGTPRGDTGAVRGDVSARRRVKRGCLFPILIRTSATMSQALRQDGSGLEGAHKKGR